MTQWNKLNPFLQNQRIKNLSTNARKYNKYNIGEFLQNPANHEPELRGLAWSQSSAQQIYYNILRRSCDIPKYLYFKWSDLLENESAYKKDDYLEEDRLSEEWLETFNPQSTLKTMALQIKREGKQSYLLRSKIASGKGGKSKHVVFATLQKMPTDWVKITGIGQLGYTISFNMMYFLNIANSPEYFGDFMVKAWNDMVTQGIVIQETDGKRKFDITKATNYTFTYEGQKYESFIETKIMGRGKANSYLFWLRMPYDICFTFGSDNSTPWVAPDTMGLLQKLQELSDYGQLAGLIASTPLTAVLTGEIEPIPNPRAGKNESIYSPEVLQGYQDAFNALTSTNIENWFFPARNIKLQQLSADVNSSEIISTATENFVESAGEGGLTITTSKPNVSQVKTAQLLAASQQDYVTRQFEQVLNFILKFKLGFKYTWKIKLWGDIFSFENEKKYLKELVLGGATFALPKLASAEGISMRDTKSIVSYIESLDIYKNFKTLTQEQQQKADEIKQKGQVGRPQLDDGDIENEATAKSREDGTNTSDNRDTLSLKCPICHGDLEEGQEICDDCLQRIIDEQE